MWSFSSESSRRASSIGKPQWTASITVGNVERLVAPRLDGLAVVLLDEGANQLAVALARAQHGNPSIRPEKARFYSLSPLARLEAWSEGRE